MQCLAQWWLPYEAKKIFTGLTCHVKKESGNVLGGKGGQRETEHIAHRVPVSLKNVVLSPYTIYAWWCEISPLYYLQI